MHHFLDFPQETITHVLACAGPASVRICSQVCHKLRIAIYEIKLLYYIYLLDRAGLCYNPFSPLPLPERLNNVEKYERAWRTLAWTGYTKIHITVNDWWTFQETIVMLHLPEQLGDHAHRIVRLPSALRGVTSHQWRVDIPESCFISAVQPCQDLLLLTTNTTVEADDLYAHPLQLSTGKPHPRARSERFCVGRGKCEMSLHDDQLLVQTYPHPALQSSDGESPEIYLNGIYNWTLGSPAKLIPAGSSQFYYLDSEHLVAIPDGHPYGEYIGIYAPPGRLGASQEEYRTLAMFELPDLYNNVDPPRKIGNRTVAINNRIVEISRSPAPSYSSYIAPGDFSLDPTDKLVSIMITDGDPLGDDQIWLQLLVPSHVLLSYIPAAYASSERVVSWDEWGPRHAHIFPHADPGVVPSTHGLRALPFPHPVPHPDGSGDWMILINDYHPRRIATARRESLLIPPDQRNWAITSSKPLDGKYTGDGEPLQTHTSFISSWQKLPREVLGETPTTVSLVLVEDCIVAYQETAPNGSLSPEDRVPIDLHIWSF